MCFMLIQDDALRSVIARTLRVKEEELNEDLMKELIHLEVQDHEIADSRRFAVCRESRDFKCKQQ